MRPRQHRPHGGNSRGVCVGCGVAAVTERPDGTRLCAGTAARNSTSAARRCASGVKNKVMDGRRPQRWLARFPFLLDPANETANELTAKRQRLSKFRHEIQSPLLIVETYTLGVSIMPNRRPILIVEDDETLRDMLTEHLVETGEFIVSTAPNIYAADTVLANEVAHFDAVILDIGLPDGDGRDYCAQLRRRGHFMPIIMLTGAVE